MPRIFFRVGGHYNIYILCERYEHARGNDIAKRSVNGRQGMFYIGKHLEVCSAGSSGISLCYGIAAGGIRNENQISYGDQARIATQLFKLGSSFNFNNFFHVDCPILK